MHVDASQARNVEHRSGQDEPICRHHHHRWRPLGELSLHRRVAKGGWLAYLQSMLERQRLDRTRAHASAPTGGPVRLGIDGHDLTLIVEQCAQDGRGE